MPHKVIWTTRAKRDLRGVFNYIAKDSVAAARRFTQKLVARSKQLASQPRSGRVVPELNVENIRELIESPYRIFYEVDASTVYVIRVVHQAQQPDDL